MATMRGGETLHWLLQHQQCEMPAITDTSQKCQGEDMVTAQVQRASLAVRRLVLQTVNQICSPLLLADTFLRICLTENIACRVDCRGHHFVFGWFLTKKILAKIVLIGAFPGSVTAQN